jgi:dipeptidyl aminopeptidase/acylaminoacyl peptidase
VRRYTRREAIGHTAVRLATRVAPFGSWSSPITAESIARGSVGLAEPELAGGSIWWIEGRPSEGGRQVVVHAALDGGGRVDAIPPGFSARTRVHEYGGGAYAVHGTSLFFSNDDDGRIYRIDPGAAPVPITPEPAEPRSLRYADLDVSPDGRLIHCVRETHGSGEAVNEIVAVAVGGEGEPYVVAGGMDFYAAPRASPDGSRIAWLSWEHPRMPWDGTELWVAPAAGGGEPRLVTGGPGASVVGPQWSPEGVLYYVSDETGWWNLYREGEALYPLDAEFGGPMWVFGQEPFAFLDDGRIACLWTRGGFPHLGLLDPESRELEELDVPLGPSFRTPRLRTDGTRLAFVGTSPTRPSGIVVMDPATGSFEVVARSTTEEPDAAYLSEPEAVEFESGGRTSHALFFPPRNPRFEGPPGDRPPLIVMIHGGPTAQALPSLSLDIQFWTSRGFAVVDVNYGGSTGYGRPYRELLNDQWGVVDVEDATSAALALAREGRVDGARLAITGGSAGGYTALGALAFTDVFHAGASYYGVADIEALFATTHKFESRYEQALVPHDQMRERSPINSVDRIDAPVIVFQGLDDPIVPPEQSEAIVEALRQRGIEHEYHAYEGESHGFRKAETIVHSLEAELAFYGRVFGFDPA